MCPHNLTKTQLEHHLNHHRNLALLGKILHETYGATKALARLPTTPITLPKINPPMQTFSVIPQSPTHYKVCTLVVSPSLVKSRIFKNHELYWSNLPQNSNFGRELVQKSGVQIPVGEGQIFLSRFLFIFIFSIRNWILTYKTLWPSPTGIRTLNFQTKLSRSTFEFWGRLDQ